MVSGQTTILSFLFSLLLKNITSAKSTSSLSEESERVKALVKVLKTLPVTLIAPETALVTAPTKLKFCFAPINPIGRYSLFEDK